MDLIIQELEGNSKYHGKLVIDLGCGNGKIQEHFTSGRFKADPLFSKIRSYDFLKMKDFVIQVDIRKLPLADESVDIAIFCLSLMGKNYLEFIEEASRCLTKGGYLIIAEVSSRFRSLTFFISMVKVLNYKLIKLARKIILKLTFLGRAQLVLHLLDFQEEKGEG